MKIGISIFKFDTSRHSKSFLDPSKLFWTRPNVFQNVKLSSEHQTVVFGSEPKQFWTHRMTRYKSKNSMHLFSGIVSGKLFTKFIRYGLIWGSEVKGKKATDNS